VRTKWIPVFALLVVLLLVNSIQAAGDSPPVRPYPSPSLPLDTSLLHKPLPSLGDAGPTDKPEDAGPLTDSADDPLHFGASRRARTDALHWWGEEVQALTSADWLRTRAAHWLANTSGRSSSARSLDLIGSNFAIADYPDRVSHLESLHNPSVAYNLQGNEYLVVWQGYDRVTGVNIYGQRLSASGSPVGGAFAISEAAGAQVVPSVAYDASAGQYWVVWTDARAGQDMDIYARRLSATGTWLGSEIVVNMGSPVAFAGRVACGGGYCAITWASQPGDGNSHILIRGFNPDGSASTPPLLLSPVSGSGTEPDVCYNPEDGHFLTVWAQLQGGTGYDVKAFRLSKELYNLGQTTIFAPGDQWVPRVAYSGAADRYLIVWQDNRSGQSWDIYGQFVGRNGSTLGAALPLFAGTFADRKPSVAGHDGASQFMIVFERDPDGSDNPQIYASTITGSGTVSSAFAVRHWYNAREAPAIAHGSGTDDYMVAWTDIGLATQEDIQAQRVRSDHTLLGELIVVSAGRKGQEAPSLAHNTTRNEYLVIWQDYRSGSDYDIYSRRVSASGERIGQEVAIHTAGSINGRPAAAFNPHDEQYLVAWQLIPTQTSGYDIYARLIGGDGSPSGAAFLISRDTNTIGEGVPEVAYNPHANEYLILWHAFTDGLWRIWGQRVSAAGQLLGRNFQVSSSPGDAQAPQLSYNTSRNEYAAVWQDFRNQRIDVYGQRLNAGGERLGGNFSVSTAAGNKGRCDIAYGAQRDAFVVVWGDTRSEGQDIYAQRLDASGGPVGSNFPIAATEQNELAPSIAYDAISQEYVVVWLEYHQATDYDLYGRRVSADGTLAGSSFPVCTAPEVQLRAELIQNGVNGEFLFVWQDFRASSYDIYGQRWIGTGTVLPTPTPTRTLTPTPTRTLTPTATRTLASTLTPSPTLQPVTPQVWLWLPVVLKQY
jgi:hypothetical protein